MDVAAAEGEAERAPTREEMAALLQRVAASARPGEKGEKALAHLLHVLLRCPWLEGDLRMELEPYAEEPEHATVHLYTEYGGIRERALPSVAFAISFADLESAISRKPDVFAPLRMQAYEGKLVFTRE